MRIQQLSKVDREQFLVQASVGQRTLHLGCVDWPLTKQKVEDGSLLHMQLLKVNPETIGADASVEGCRMLQESGVEGIYCVDPTAPLANFIDQKFDLIIAGEIIEHLYDFEGFFESLRAVSHPDTKVIITTPNYANVKKLPALLWSDEVIHPDHTCYFSQATLTKVLTHCGWKPTQWHSYWYARRRSAKIYNWVLSRFGFMQIYADGIIVEAKQG